MQYSSDCGETKARYVAVCVVAMGGMVVEVVESELWLLIMTAT